MNTITSSPSRFRRSGARLQEGDIADEPSPPQQQAALHPSSQRTGCSAIRTSMAEKVCAAMTTGRPQNRRCFLAHGCKHLRTTDEPDGDRKCQHRQCPERNTPHSTPGPPAKCQRRTDNAGGGQNAKRYNPEPSRGVIKICTVCMVDAE